jgi:gamma-glutamyltranspeptidase/glutathione hydrolase
MHEFVFGVPEHPFAIRPDGMPLSSMSPTVLARDGRPALAVGSPGSARIISAVTQVVQLWVDEGLSIDEAVATPRIHALPGQRFYMEARQMPGEVRRTMEGLGYTFPEVSWDLSLNGLNAYFGGVHAVAFDGNVWRGAADPRRDGAVRYATR